MSSHRFFFLIIGFGFLMGCNQACNESRIKVIEKENAELRTQNDSLIKSRSPFQIITEGLNKENLQIQEVSNIESEVIDLLELKGQIKALEDFNLGVHNLNQLINLTDSLFELVVVESGGYNDLGRIKHLKDKAGSNAILIDLGLGQSYKEKCNTTADLIDQTIEKWNLNISSSDLFIRRSDYYEKFGKSFSEHLFRDMPVGALQPLFMKMKNDLLSAKAKFIYEFQKAFNN